jgi:hypothetical protein
MNAQTLTTTFAGDTYGVRADWSDAASPVAARSLSGEYVPTVYQVADFCHDPHAALRRDIEDTIRLSDDDPEDIRAEIEAAVKAAKYID